MTAVEYLVKGLPMVYWEDPYYSDLLEQAKEMEKQQQGYSEDDLKNAFLDGWQLRDGDLPFPKAKNKWFNEFKK